MSNTAEICEQYQMPTYNRSITITKAKGTRVWQDRQLYLDFTSGISVVALGHAHPAVVDAIKAQAELCVHTSNLFYSEPVATFAEKLAKVSPLGGKVFLANSGAEANEAMIKLARLWGSQNGGRYEIVCMRQSFHGRTIATVSATGQSKIQNGFDPLLPGFKFATFNDLESVKAAVTDKTVGIMLECVQGEGGVIPGTPEFIQGVRALCDEKNLLMMCDEIQCGMGRTGRMWGFEWYDVKPDMFTSAKALGGGLPLSALCATPALSDVFQPGTHGTTFGGNPVACAAGSAVLDVFAKENVVANACKMGAKLREALTAIIEKYDDVLEVRGAGLLQGIVLKDERAGEVVEELRNGGLLACTAGKNVVRLLPPLNVTEDELDEGLEMIADTLDIVFGDAE